jgi:uncharacterized CHY-type Zn-finger protein
MTEKQDTKWKIWDVLMEMDTEEAVRTLTNYHGMQLLDGGFYEHLKDEGYITGETIECGTCQKEIDVDEWEENGSPECFDCNTPLCPGCLTSCSDENDRCPPCAKEYEDTQGNDPTCNDKTEEEENE